MKTPIAVILILVFAFFGCDKDDFKSLPLQYEVEIPILSAADTAEKAAIIDASTNKDFLENKDAIDKLEVSKIEYSITEMAAGSADSILNGKILVRNPSGNYQLLANIPASKFVLNEKKALVLDAAAVAILSAAAKNAPHRAALLFTGKLNKVPVNFTVLIALSMKLNVKL